MSPLEIKDALGGMVVLVDTREQDTPRLRARLQQMQCKTAREALGFGDYSAKFPLPGGEWYSLKDKIVVERKMHLDELCHCYCQDRKRFEREFARAKEAGARTYLLIENATWEQAYAGNYRSQMSPEAFTASLLAWLARYDCRLIMCKEQTSGRLIRDILFREGKEHMEGGADG